MLLTLKRGDSGTFCLSRAQTLLEISANETNEDQKHNGSEIFMIRAIHTQKDGWMGELLEF